MSLVVVGGIRGERDDVWPPIPRIGADPSGGFEPVQTGHLAVHHQHGDAFPAEDLQRSWPLAARQLVPR